MIAFELTPAKPLKLMTAQEARAYQTSIDAGVDYEVPGLGHVLIGTPLATDPSTVPVYWFKRGRGGGALVLSTAVVAQLIEIGRRW